MVNGEMCDAESIFSPIFGAFQFTEVTSQHFFGCGNSANPFQRWVQEVQSRPDCHIRHIMELLGSHDVV